MRTALAGLALLASTSAALSPIYDFFASQARATLLQLGGVTNAYPSNGQPGKYGWLTSTSKGWTSGFFPGHLLQLYNLTGDEAFLTAGRTLTYGLAEERFDTSTHDVGFIMYPSFGRLWAYTQDATARAYLLTTADSLSTRFSRVVGCTRSWNSPPPTFEVIADNLMNLELLWWATAASGNASYAAIAHSHAARMQRDLFQPFNPGCAWHLITYNQDTGALLNRSSTPQGLGLDTVWARGQAWALNGYTLAYRYTRTPAYLQQARDAAACFTRLLTACCGEASGYHWAPLWDFNVTAPHIAVDTSAMMIAAEALVELSGFTAGAEAQGYYAMAKTLLEAAEQYYLFSAAENDAVLRNGTVTYPLAGISITYGDYCAWSARCVCCSAQ